MVDLAVAKPDTLTSAEVKRRRVRATIPFLVAREKFGYWHQENVGIKADWDNPMTAQLFHAWVAGSGITEWESDEEIARRERINESRRASKEKMDRLRQEAEQNRRRR